MGIQDEYQYLLQDTVKVWGLLSAWERPCQGDWEIYLWRTDPKSAMRDEAAVANKAMANYLALKIRWQWSQQSLQRPLPQPGSALAGPLAELLYNIFWFSHSFKLLGRPWPSPCSLDHNEESRVLVNLPASFPLQPWEGNGNGCCLWFAFPPTSFEFNLESEICGFWQMVFVPFLHLAQVWYLVLHSPLPTGTAYTDWRPAPFSVSS